jgi:hypothetical protein
MNVHFMATYYSPWAHNNLAPRSQDQWHSFKFCRAVKNRRINGSLVFPWQTGPEVIDESSAGRARIIFGEFIKYVFDQTGIKDAVLVPVPSKDGLVSAHEFRSYTMVKEAAANRWIVAPALRFTAALQPAAAGGPRGRELLRPYLAITQAIPAGSIILVDDIVTTGGSLLASYDILSTAGRPPTAAIVCGHTVSDSLLSSFGHHQKNIDTTPQRILF